MDVPASQNIYRRTNIREFYAFGIFHSGFAAAWVFRRHAYRDERL